MKKIPVILLAVLVMFQITSCGEQDKEKVPTWQEQYDLGLRYLEEGNYEEAILAFTAAIEIDPKQAPAYVGRGDAYMLSGETEENLTAAQADYEKAIELDESNADAYLGLADVYIRRGDYDKALEVLQSGLNKTRNNKAITEKIDELEDTYLGDYNDSVAKSNFKTLDTYIDSNQSPDIELLVSDLIVMADAHMDWDELYLWIEDIDARNVVEFYTEFKGWKIHYKPHFVEMRQEQGYAYCYKGMIYPSFFVVGNTSNWNWNGEYKEYMIYGGPDDIQKGWLGGPAMETIGYAINGLLDGEHRGAICNEDGTYNTYGEYELYGKYQNGHRLYPNYSGESETILFSVTAGYSSYEDYEKYELWD